MQQHIKRWSLMHHRCDPLFVTVAASKWICLSRIPNKNLSLHIDCGQQFPIRRATDHQKPTLVSLPIHLLSISYFFRWQRTLQVCRGVCESRFQCRTMASPDPLANRFPSGLNPMFRTASICPCNDAVQRVTTRTRKTACGR